ncbi:MAG: flagellar brake protein [Rhodocyclaceae bacterium]|nr:flagellar brake protein [Rhodocyclaceae bacterium]
MIATPEDNAAAFDITFRREIAFYLRQLINDGELVSVIFDEGRETFLTVLLEIDEETDTLVFDWGGSEEINARLLDSPRTFFIANPQGVRNQFIASRIWKTNYQGRPAFATAIPQRFVRMQRRDFFRLSLPLTQRRPCSFKLGEAATPWEMAVVDIGIGGVGLEAPEETLPFTPGQVIPRATIDLGKYGKLEMDLAVCFVGTVTRGYKNTGRLGCRFVKLTHPQENDLQRFVTQVQREERAKLG